MLCPVMRCTDWGGQGTKPDALIMVALKIVTCMCDAPAGQQEGVAHDFFIATF